MIRYVAFGSLVWVLSVSVASGQQAIDRAELGPLANGAAITFVRAGSGDWGIEISGGTAVRLTQQRPAQIEIFAGEENVRQLAAGYQSVKREGHAIVAATKVAGAGRARGPVLRLVRAVLCQVVQVDQRRALPGCGDISCYYSKDGQKWFQYKNSTSVSGSRSVSLYAAGQGDVVFRDFKYRGLD